MPIPDQRYPTMADVAERAGVSVSTVSRTLRGMATVSSEARERVEQAARELEFVVSRQASSLVTGRTGNVAVLAPTLSSWFVGCVLQGLSTQLSGAGLDLLIYPVAEMSERQAFFERLPARRNADALMVLSFDLTEEETARLDRLGMPVVYVSRKVEGRPSVYVDDVAGGRAATRHLLTLGHRRIAYLCGNRSDGFTYSSRQRRTGCLEALAEAGTEPALVREVSHSRRATLEAIGELTTLSDPPTAVFAETDELALELLTALREARIDVPQQLSMVGFDDHPVAEWAGLTTVAQDPVSLGAVAGGLVTELIANPDADPAPHRELPLRLIPRASTVRPGR